MMTETLEKTYTIEEYFALEDRSEEKREYHNGKITTLSGGTTDHSKIAVKIITALSILLDDQPLEVYNSDIKIQIPAYNKFVYSDVAVVSGSPEYYQGRRDTITNPLLVVEILSPSTQRHDRTDKFMMYRTLPSLKEYVLVEQEQPRITTFYRNEAQHWEDTDVEELTNSIALRSVDGALALSNVYKGIDFDA